MIQFGFLREKVYYFGINYCLKLKKQNVTRYKFRLLADRQQETSSKYTESIPDNISQKSDR